MRDWLDGSTARDFPPDAPRCPECERPMWHYKGSAWTCELGHRVHRESPPPAPEPRPQLRVVPEAPVVSETVQTEQPVEWWERVVEVPVGVLIGGPIIGGLLARVLTG